MIKNNKKLLFCPKFTNNNNNNNNSNNNNDNDVSDCNNDINNNNNNNNQQPKLIIEIDEDSDIEILSYYNDFEIIKTEKSAIKYENPEEAPKTLKVTMILRDPKQQIKFRKELLKHYGKCIISGLDWTDEIDACHIMPFKQVGSSLKTGIILRKELHCLWDRYKLSINPHTWKVHLSEEGRFYKDFLKYHDIKISDDIILLLEKKANIELLKQHHEIFLEYEKKRSIKLIEYLMPKEEKKNMRDNKEKEEINKIYESQDVERLDLVKDEYEKNKYLLKLQYNMIGKSITKNWLKQFLFGKDFLLGSYQRIKLMVKVMESPQENIEALRAKKKKKRFQPYQKVQH
jgi:hypothetical protein